MSYEHEKPEGEPTLPEMTEAALQSLNRLDREEENKGFFLMVEGGEFDQKLLKENMIRHCLTSM